MARKTSRRRPKRGPASRRPSSSLLLRLLVGLFVAGAVAALLWPRGPSEPPTRTAVSTPRGPTATHPEGTPPKTARALTRREAISPQAAAGTPSARERAAPGVPVGPAPAAPEAATTTVASAPVLPQPAVPGRPAWLRNAVPASPPEGRPAIVVVLDDMGLNRSQSRRAIALPGPLTLSFLTYADDLPQQTAAARAAGHELMLHVPMEPMDSAVPPGPEALLVSADDAELRRRLNWGLGRFEGFVGINNHMGSRFTRNEPGMSVVLAELHRRGLLFLDSVTAGGTVGASIAKRLDVPFAKRDVFLDHRPDRASVRDSLAALERKATAQGYAVGIGHPREETIDVLENWLPTLEARGFVLVPITSAVKRLRDAQARRHEVATPPGRG